MKNYDLIIVGGGPAGLTAGIYACRYGIKTLVIEKLYFGGQLNISSEIENFPSYEHITGVELAEKMSKHYSSCGGDNIITKITNIDFENKIVETKNEKYTYKTLILAMGAVPRKLELENEEELTGKGVSYCAVCDGFFFKDKDVVVVGSGNSALEDAVYLSDICKTVTIVSKHKDFVGQDIFIKEMQAKNNIKYFMGYQPSKINGNETLESIEVTETNGSKTKKIKTSGMFIQIGRRPDVSLVKDKIECTPIGFIKTDENLQTNIKNVFAVGDIRDTKLRQIITACADGAIAATNAFKALNE